MNILLLNTNPVVSRLVSLCVREDDIVLEEVSDIAAVTGEGYDLLFVDDLSYVEEVKKRLPEFSIGKKVFLSSKHSEDISPEDFDEVIKKPFLPSQITSVIEAFKAEKEEDTPVGEVHSEEKAEASDLSDEDVSIFPLSTEEKSEEKSLEEAAIGSLTDVPSETSSVLDVKEIDKIKALLDENEKEDEVDPEEDYEVRKVKVITEQLASDGLEIVTEDEIVDILSQEPRKKKFKKEKEQKKKTKKEKKSLKKEKEETYTFEEALIAAIEGMKIKKIRKLLKHADVHITISFKDEK